MNRIISGNYIINFFIFCTLLLPQNSHAQQYKTDSIFYHTDNMVIHLIGKRLFRYCLLDEQSYYAYGKGADVQYAPLTTEMKHAHSNFKSATVIYHFAMPYTACNWMDSIKGDIVVTLDSLLNISNEPDAGFIPKGVHAKDTTCDFIEAADALKAAKEENIRTSINQPYTYMQYNDNTHGYEWIVLQTLWDEQNQNGANPTMQDMVVIDAITGAALQHKVVPYAPHR